MRKITKILIMTLLIISVLFLRHIYTYRTMGIIEAIRPNADEIKRVEILFNNETKIINKKDDINKLLEFFDKYKIKKDKNNKVIRLNDDIYMLNILSNNNASYIIPQKNQITIDGYNYNIVDNNLDINYFDKYWK
ncbi:MAG: hypothetical protein FH751_05685 [Firmicutes bacterium]|nr:hypothetical protein [Bacillota bacterium]